MVEPAVITEKERGKGEKKKKLHRRLETIKYFYSACEHDCSNLDLIMQRLFAFIVLFIQLREELLCANTFFFFPAWVQFLKNNRCKRHGSCHHVIISQRSAD